MSRSIPPEGEWRPAETFALEQFEVPCRADVWFYGSYGDEASVREEDEDAGFCFELNPNDRARVIDALEKMLTLMRSADR